MINSTAFPESFPSIRRLGEQSLIVYFGSEYSPIVNRAVVAFDKHVRYESPRGLAETVPAIRSILIRFDVATLELEEARRWCERHLSATDWYSEHKAHKGRTHKIPVVYGGSDCSDLREIAGACGLSVRRLIELHSGAMLDVVCLGFAPGLAYLAELPKEFDVPRKESYSSRVPAGSVLVANRQTVFTATPIPTGWRCIGKSPVIGFQPRKKHPFLLSSGDRVQFFSVTDKEAERFDQDPWNH